MAKLLVTGASGFLGQYLLAEGQKSYNVVGTHFESEIPDERGTAVQVDLTEPPFPSLREFNPSYVIHCAALTDVDKCERKPALARRLNVDMTEHVAEFADRIGAKLMILSTDAVFDGSRGRWTESDQPNPINVYGETKRDAERVARHVHEKVTVVRTNFFGWTPGNRLSLAEWMLKTLAAGEELTGFEDVFFTPLYAGDLASYLLELLKMDTPDVLHLAGSERLSKFEFARTLADVFGHDGSFVTPIGVSELDLAAPRGRDLSLDASRGEALLNRTFPDARTGLERMKLEKEK